jgi:quinohemoprotein amine dehydrogenase
MTVSGSGEDYTTSVTLRSLTDGSTLTRSGSGIVYTGYSWRGSSKGAGDTAAPDSRPRRARGHVVRARSKSAVGRWYWGAYEEFGFDVKLTRASADGAIAAVSPDAEGGHQGRALHIIGDKLPHKPALGHHAGQGRRGQGSSSASAEESC